MGSNIKGPWQPHCAMSIEHEIDILWQRICKHFFQCKYVVLFTNEAINSFAECCNTVALLVVCGVVLHVLAFHI